MSVLEQRSILIKSGELESDGLLYSQVFTPQERLRPAMKVWGLSWLLALASVPIIVAHWVLVPGFFLAGPIWAYKRYRTPSVPDHVSGHCPMRHEEISVPWRPPTDCRCGPIARCATRHCSSSSGSSLRFVGGNFEKSSVDFFRDENGKGDFRFSLYSNRFHDWNMAVHLCVARNL